MSQQIPRSVAVKLRRQFKSILAEREAAAFERGKEEMQAKFDALLERHTRLKELNGTSELFKSVWEESKHKRDHGKFAKISDAGGDSAQGGSQGSSESPPAPSHQNVSNSHEAHSRKLLSRLKDVPHALVERVSSFVSTKYAGLVSKYGKAGAKAVLAATILLLPVPIPGTSFLPVAIAEAIRRIHGAVKGTETKAVEDDHGLTDDEVQAAAKELLAEIEAEHGEDTGHDPDAIAAAMIEHAVEALELGEDPTGGLERLRALLPDDEETVEKAFDESKHPRDKNGRFIGKDDLKAAQTDPGKAAELRERVNPEDAGKLEDVISGKEDPGRTKQGQAKHEAGERRQAKAETKARADALIRKLSDANAKPGSVEITPADLHALADHLPGMTVADLRRARMAMRASFAGNTRKQGMVEALVKHARGDVSADQNAVPARTQIDLSDPRALSASIHEVAASMPDWAGNAHDPTSPFPHKVAIAHLYDAMADKLGGATLDEFKAAIVAANRSGTLTAEPIDMPQAMRDQNAYLRSEAKMAGGAMFHAVSLPRGHKPPPDDNGPGGTPAEIPVAIQSPESIRAATVAQAERDHPGIGAMPRSKLLDLGSKLGVSQNAGEQLHDYRARLAAASKANREAISRPAAVAGWGDANPKDRGLSDPGEPAVRDEFGRPVRGQNLSQEELGKRGKEFEAKRAAERAARAKLGTDRDAMDAKAEHDMPGITTMPEREWRARGAALGVKPGPRMTIGDYRAAVAAAHAAAAVPSETAPPVAPTTRAESDAKMVADYAASPLTSEAKQKRTAGYHRGIERLVLEEGLDDTIGDFFKEKIATASEAEQQRVWEEALQWASRDKPKVMASAAQVTKPQKETQNNPPTTVDKPTPVGNTTPVEPAKVAGGATGAKPMRVQITASGRGFKQAVDYLKKIGAKYEPNSKTWTLPAGKEINHDTWGTRPVAEPERMPGDHKAEDYNDTDRTPH